MDFDSLMREKKNTEIALEHQTEQLKKITSEETAAETRSFEILKAKLQVGLDEANRIKANLATEHEFLRHQYEQLAQENSNLKVSHLLDRLGEFKHNIRFVS